VVTDPDVSQIYVNGHQTGVIGLKAALEAVAADFKDRPDDDIRAEMLRRLGKKNYIPARVQAAYAEAFLREFKKFTGQAVVDETSPVLQIKVLGPGCRQCDQLQQDLMSLLAALQVPADLEHVTDIEAISRYGVMAMPALVINGDVVAAGSMPPKSGLQELIRQAAEKHAQVSTGNREKQA